MAGNLSHARWQEPQTTDSGSSFHPVGPIRMSVSVHGSEP